MNIVKILLHGNQFIFTVAWNSRNSFLSSYRFLCKILTSSSNDSSSRSAMLPDCIMFVIFTQPQHCVTLLLTRTCLERERWFCAPLLPHLPQSTAASRLHCPPPNGALSDNRGWDFTAEEMGFSNQTALLTTPELVPLRYQNPSLSRDFKREPNLNLH